MSNCVRRFASIPLVMALATFSGFSAACDWTDGDASSNGAGEMYIQNETNLHLTLVTEVKGAKYPRYEDLEPQTAWSHTFDEPPIMLYLVADTPEASFKIEAPRGGLVGPTLLIVSDAALTQPQNEAGAADPQEQTVVAYWGGMVRVVNDRPHEIQVATGFDGYPGLRVVPSGEERLFLGRRRIDVVSNQGVPSYRLYFLGRPDPPIVITLPGEPFALPTPRPLEPGLCTFLPEGCPDE